MIIIILISKIDVISISKNFTLYIIDSKIIYFIAYLISFINNNIIIYLVIM